MAMFKKQTCCRACGDLTLFPVLSLGEQPLANAFKPRADFPEFKFPLEVLLCGHCGLAQLSIVVKGDILYTDYPYVTPRGPTMRFHLLALGEEITRHWSAPGRVLEIGSNEGFFLERLREYFNADVTGIEPSAQLAATSKERGIPTVCDFFTFDACLHYRELVKPFDLIVARHVFAHIDDWDEFMQALGCVCHNETVVAIEVPYVIEQLRHKSFDQIYHEHLSYVSISALQHLLETTPWRLHKVTGYSIHGGSVLIMLRRRDSDVPVDPSVAEYLRMENSMNLSLAWGELANQTKFNVTLLRDFVRHARSLGKTVYGYGASAKATVWINACGFDLHDLAGVYDSTPYKQGRFVPGTDIPILAEPDFTISKPDYVVMFAWNFGSEIMGKHPALVANGGHWIMPVPEVRVFPEEAVLA